MLCSGSDCFLGAFKQCNYFPPVFFLKDIKPASLLLLQLALCLTERKKEKKKRKKKKEKRENWRGREGSMFFPLPTFLGPYQPSAT